ncbi:hypothetical protein [Aureivirga marina]|uniref:hypothetical protein n=1 Tax=Aureivirga marina TaxID=1182451 RepID=UPI0018C957F6|nr:hypothetical protein [Aureivirga marina]
MGKFKLTCDEATMICDKSQYGEATFSEKLKLNFHVLFCKFCKRYSAQNAKLTDIFKSTCSLSENKQKMSMDDKDEISKKFHELLEKNS